MRDSFGNKSLYHLLIFFGVSFSVLIFKLLYIQVYSYSEFKKQASRQQVSEKKINYSRGDIISSDGKILATNNITYNLVVDPKIITEKEKYLEMFLKTIDFENEAEKNSFISKYNTLINVDNHYQIIKNNLSYTDKNEIEAINFVGISFEKVIRRYYPEDRLASNVLGFVAESKTDKYQGYSGIEGKNNNLLKGREGRIVYEKGAKGQTILFGNYDQADSIDGDHIVLTINRSIQYIIEKKLKEGVEKYGAKSGQIIVMEPKTGDILGMANFPNLNPYDPYNSKLDTKENFKSELNDKNITNAFEPGSVVKPITIAAALDLNTIRPEDTFFDNGPAMYSEKYIDNWDKKHLGELNLTQILQKSNNIATAQIGMKLGEKNLKEYLKKFGYSYRTGIDLEGEEAGLMKSNDVWADLDIVSASFGQSFTSTNLQILSSFNVFANDGNYIKPKIIKKLIKPNQSEIEFPTINERRVISKRTNDLMEDILAKSTSQNEGKFFALKNYNISGKTGTAQIYNNGRYVENKTNASFVGYLTNSKKFSMIVRLEEPSSSTYAAETALPLWMQTAEDLVNFLNIPTDL
jgi:cell division protein FtsI/penicillin-binding protein 2